MLSNPKKTKDDIIQWICDYFAENGPDCSAVIGISGGQDSTIAAALCVEALGRDRVFGVMMPNGIQPDIADSCCVVECLGIRSMTVDISSAFKGMHKAISDAAALAGFIYDTDTTGLSKQAQINLPPRLRMATLYAIAQSLPNGGRVVNTCNMSEDYVGYSTKFGDSAGDFSPLANLTVYEVRQIGHELPIPKELVDKTPSDGLCGKTDEDNLGFTYAQLEDYIYAGTCDDPEVDAAIAAMHGKNLHKIRPMPTFSPQESDYVETSAVCC